MSRANLRYTAPDLSAHPTTTFIIGSWKRARLRQLSLANREHLFASVSAEPVLSMHGGFGLARGGIVVVTTGRIARMVMMLCAARGACISRQELEEALFGDRDDGGPLVVSSYLGKTLSDARVAVSPLGIVLKTKPMLGICARFLSVGAHAA